MNANSNSPFSHLTIELENLDFENFEIEGIEELRTSAEVPTQNCVSCKYCAQCSTSGR